MYKKMLWGLSVLVLLICTAFVFMTVRNLAEIRQLKEGIAAAEKPLEDSNKRKPVAKADEQPPAEQGFKWVWHNDHWDKVPIDTPDVWQGEPHAPIMQQEQLSPLTQNDRKKLWVSENGRTLRTFTAEGWAIPEGTLPSEIDLAGANALRKKLFTGLTNSEVHQYDVSTLSHEEKKLFPQAIRAELYHRNPELDMELRKAHERLRDVKLANPELFGEQ